MASRSMHGSQDARSQDARSTGRHTVDLDEYDLDSMLADLGPQRLNDLPLRGVVVLPDAQPKARPSKNAIGEDVQEKWSALFDPSVAETLETDDLGHGGSHRSGPNFRPILSRPVFKVARRSTFMSARIVHAPPYARRGSIGNIRRAHSPPIVSRRGRVSPPLRQTDPPSSANQPSGSLLGPKPGNISSAISAPSTGLRSQNFRAIPGQNFRAVPRDEGSNGLLGPKPAPKSAGLKAFNNSLVTRHLKQSLTASPHSPSSPAAGNASPWKSGKLAGQGHFSSTLGGIGLPSKWAPSPPQVLPPNSSPKIKQQHVMEAPTPQIPLPSKWAPSPPQAPPNPAPPPPPPPPADSPKVKQEHVTTALMTQTLPPYKRGTHSSEITPPGNLQEQVKEAIKRHLNAPQPLPSRWAPIQPGPIVADGLAIKKENASELPKQSAPVSALETPEALPVKAFSSILGQSEWATNTQPYLPTLERAQKQETLPQSKSSAPLPSKWAPQSTTSSDTIQPSQPPSLQINEPNRSEPKSLTDNVTTSKSPIALTSSAISSMAAITPSEKRFKTPSSVASSYATSATPPPRAPSSIASQSPSVASSVYSPAASKKSAAIPIRRSDYIRPMPVSSKNPWANNPKIGINTSRSGSQEHATPSRQKSPSVLGPVKPSTSKPLAKTSSNALSIVSSEFKHQSSQTDATKMESEKPTIEKIEELAIAKPVSGEDINSGAAKSTIETVIKVEMETEDSMQTARKLGGGKLQPLQHDGDGEEDATASTKLKDNDAQMDVSVQEPLLPSKPFYENLHARYAFATPRQINALARRFGTLCLGELEGMTRSI